MGDLDRRKVGVISVPAVDVLSIEPLKKKGKYQSKYSTMNRQREKDSNSDDTALFAVTASNLLLDFMKPIEVAQQLACSLYYDGGDPPINFKISVKSLFSSHQVCGIILVCNRGMI